MLDKAERGADIAALMDGIGRKARAAARPLAVAECRAQACGAGRHGPSHRAQHRCDPGRQRARHGKRRRSRSVRGIARPAEADEGSRARDGRRHPRDRRDARSRRRGDRRMGPAQRPPHRARAHAARRHRRHLREPAQRHCRRRRALPEGRQCGDPARRFGFGGFVIRHPCLSGRRAEGGQPAGRGHPVCADHRPRRRRRNAQGALRQSRRHHPARRARSRRARAEGGARAGVRASGGHLPRLCRQVRRSRDGQDESR